MFFFSDVVASVATGLFFPVSTSRNTSVLNPALLLVIVMCLCVQRFDVREIGDALFSLLCEAVVYQFAGKVERDFRRVEKLAV